MGATQTKYIAIDGKSCQYHGDADEGEFDKLNAKKIDPDVYARSEFMAMGRGNTGTLTTSEFENLILFLGYTKPEVILRKVDKTKDGHMNLTEYIEATKLIKEEECGQARYRNMFREIDKSGDALAPIADVVKAYENMGITITPEIRKKIEAMDENNDGKISYLEFLRSQLKQKNIISS